MTRVLAESRSFGLFVRQSARFPNPRGRDFEVVADAPFEGFDRLYASDPFGNRVGLMEAVAGPPGEA